MLVYIQNDLEWLDHWEGFARAALAGVTADPEFNSFQAVEWAANVADDMMKELEKRMGVEHVR